MSVGDYKPEVATFGVEFREAGGDGRTLTGLIVPYNETTEDSPYAQGERFVPGSFRKAVREFRGRSRKRPLLLFRGHDHSTAIGLATDLTEGDEGLVGEFRLGRTPGGDAALVEHREGLLGSMSVGFRALRDRRGDDGAREVVEAAILEASLVPIGAYEGAQVLSLRAPSAHKPDLAWVTLPPAPSIDLSRPVGLWR
jgi:HK97 family phage prohead protease